MRRRRWRFYETVSGAKPVQAFLENLSATEAAQLVARIVTPDAERAWVARATRRTKK